MNARLDVSSSNPGVAPIASVGASASSVHCYGDWRAGADARRAA